MTGAHCANAREAVPLSLWLLPDYYPLIKT
jgi:hypothetical protein